MATPRTGRPVGRPKGSKGKKTLEKEAAREFVRQFVIARLEPMLQAQVEAAKGYKYIVARDAKGGKFRPISEAELKKYDPERTIVEVWEKPPSTQAFTDLMNRALDKPKEQHEVEVKGLEGLAARLAAGRGRAKGE